MAEFAEDIASVEPENAKVYRLEPDNRFMTKRFPEREDTSTNYLIDAPFPKPDVKDNHLGRYDVVFQALFCQSGFSAFCGSRN